MARYKKSYGKYGKSTTLVYTLFAAALLELVLLAGMVVWTVQNRPPAQTLEDNAAGKEDAADQQPTEEPPPDEIVEPPPEPKPEPVREKEKPADERSGWDILSEEQFIIHGLGELDDVHVLNCLEAFQQQYEQGVRAFEVDLRLTADQQVILRHDWRAGWQDGISETSVPTLEEFLERPVLGKYTPLSFRDLLLLMEEYPDICIITDSKFVDAEIVTLQFEAMLRDAEELGLSYLFDRMVIQVYNSLMFKVVDNIHHFENYVYTLYYEGFSATEDSFRTKAAFCEENGIRGITMWDYWWRPEFAPIAGEYGIRTFTHTVNDLEEALALLDSGVNGIYTDSLTPADLAPPEEEPAPEEETGPEEALDAEAESHQEEGADAEGEPRPEEETGSEAEPNPEAEPALDGEPAAAEEPDNAEDISPEAE